MKKIIFIIFLCLFITGCNDDSYSKAKCNDIEYDIVSITRWSNSNYELKLKNGEVIEVHPMNCMFYN